MVYLKASLACLAGSLFHPTFLVIPLCIAFFALCVYALKPLRRQKAASRAASIILLTAGVFALILVPFFIPLVKDWYEQSRSLAGGWGYGYFRLTLQFIKYFSLPVCAATFIGTIMMFRESVLRGCFLVVTMGAPILLMLAASAFVDVRPDYIYSIFPVFFIAASRFFAYIWHKYDWGRFLSTGLLVSFIVFMMPEFVSNYTGKRSLDVRKAVRYIDSAYQEGDKILSFLKGFNYYMEGKHPVEPYLGSWYHSGWNERMRKYEKDDNRLWIVYMDSRDGVNPELKAWLHEHAMLKLEVSDRRFDYTFRSVRVYLKE